MLHGIKKPCNSGYVFDEREICGLGKIAYLMTVRTLGDAFVNTTGAAQYRKWLNAEPTHEALCESGLIANWPTPIGSEFNTLPEHFHVLTCLVMDGKVATFVRLFNHYG